VSDIIGDAACPACRETGHDTAGDHLILFADGGAYCSKAKHHENGKAYHDNNFDGKVEVKSIPKRDLGGIDNMQLKGIQDLPVKGLQSRKISAKVAERYNIHTGHDSSTGEPSSYYYPITKDSKVIAYKQRVLPKDFYWVGSIKDQQPELFGQSTCQAGGKKLLITEGQDDMLAACQMLWAKYPDFTPNVVSLIHGDKASSVADNLEFVNSYDEVLIYTDMDDAGRKVGKEIAKLVGSKARMVVTQEKDANDMLIKGKSSAFINAFFQAQPYVPDEILTVDDVYEDAIEMPTWGRRWPWPSMDKLTYGRRDGEGIFVGAAVKAGKTEWLSQMVHHITEVEGKKVFLIKFEQDPGQTVKAVAGKIAHKAFHKPDGNFTKDELIAAVDKTRGKLLMFDASFADIGHTNVWDRLKLAIRHAVLVEGVTDVFIDPITQLTDGLSASDTETELRRFSNEISGMAKDLGFFYYCFCHLKSPEGNNTHEEGAQVKVAQFRGSRAMAEKTKFMLGIIRDQYADDEVDRNTFFDENTGDYLESTGEVAGGY